MLLQSRRMLRDEEVDASGEATRGKDQEEQEEPAAEPPTTEAGGTEEKKRKGEGPRESNRSSMTVYAKGQCNCPCERPNVLVNLIDDDDPDASLFVFQCPCTDCGPRKQIEGKIVRRCTTRMMLPEFLCEDCRDCREYERARKRSHLPSAVSGGRFSTMLQ